MIFLLVTYAFGEAAVLYRVHMSRFDETADLWVQLHMCTFVAGVCIEEGPVPLGQPFNPSTKHTTSSRAPVEINFLQKLPGIFSNSLIFPR